MVLNKESAARSCAAKKCFEKFLSEFTGKHLSRSQADPANLFKKTLQHWFFPVNFWE